MQKIIEKAVQLKKTLVDFVYDAEGEIAVAMETYAAAKSKTNSYGIKQQNLTIDLFITEGKVSDKTPLDIFLEQNRDLDSKDIELIKLWPNNFIGLFELQEIQDNYYQLMNWLTAKTYKVYRHSEMSDKEINRWQPGEIILST